MKVTVNQKNLKKALSIVEKVIAKNISLPILNNLLLKTENGRLKISATNLELGINYLIGAKIEEVGEIAVPAKIFSDFVNGLADDKIVLSTKNKILSINSVNYKTQILGFDTKDFPIIPKLKDKPFCIIPSRSVKNSLLSVLDATSISESRPELAGVFVNFEGKNIIFAATDSFRLSEKTVEFKSTKQLSFILPRNTVVELIRITGELEGEINIYIGDNQIFFSNDEFEMVSRLVDGNYPDYRKVIPEKFVSKALIKKDDLEKNIRLAGIFSSNISDIKIYCVDNKLKITGKNSEKGEIEVEIDAVLKNEPFEVSLNYHYLLDGLKTITTERVIIEFTGTGSPLVLKPADDKKDTIYLIMPFRN
jgi:DNA polymerase-3 subunit beta